MATDYRSAFSWPRLDDRTERMSPYEKPRARKQTSLPEPMVYDPEATSIRIGETVQQAQKTAVEHAPKRRPLKQQWDKLENTVSKIFDRQRIRAGVQKIRGFVEPTSPQMAPISTVGTMLQVDRPQPLGWALVLTWLLPAGGIFFLGRWPVGLVLIVIWLSGVLASGFPLLIAASQQAGIQVTGSEWWAAIYLSGMLVLGIYFLVCYRLIFQMQTPGQATHGKQQPLAWLATLLFPGSGQLLTGQFLRGQLTFMAAWLLLTVVIGVVYQSLLPQVSQVVWLGYWLDQLLAPLVLMSVVCGVIYLYGIYDAGRMGLFPHLRYDHADRTDWRFVGMGLVTVGSLAVLLIGSFTAHYYRQQLRGLRVHAVQRGFMETAEQLELLEKKLGSSHQSLMHLMDGETP